MEKAWSEARQTHNGVPYGTARQTARDNHQVLADEIDRIERAGVMGRG